MQRSEQKSLKLTRMAVEKSEMRVGHAPEKRLPITKTSRLAHVDADGRRRVAFHGHGDAPFSELWMPERDFSNS
jgi:hypothetical protein